MILPWLSRPKRLLLLVAGPILLLASILTLQSLPRLQALGHQRAAVALLDNLTARDPHSTGFPPCNAGLPAAARPEPLERAIEHLQQAIELDPSNSYAFLLLARAECKLGDFAAAVESYGRFVALRPQNPLGYAELAFSMEAQCADDAEQRAQKALPQPLNRYLPCRDPEQLTELRAIWLEAALRVEDFVEAGQSAAERGELASALTWYARGAVFDPAAGLPWQRAAELLLESGDVIAAESALQQTLRLDQNDRPSWYLLGKILLDRGRPGEAVAAFEKGLAARGDQVGDSNFWFMIGHTFQRASALADPEAAWEAYQLALDADSFVIDGWQKAETYQRRGLLLERQRKLEQALQEYDRALMINPSHYAAHINKARALLGLGQDREAFELANRAIALQPDRKEAYWFLANYHRSRGETDQAIATLEKLLAIDPEDSAAQEMLDELRATGS